MFPNGTVVTQSTAILELVEELYKDIPLLPSDPFERARVRSIMNIISCDIQPVQNLRVLNYVGETKAEWAKHFITLGFEGVIGSDVALEGVVGTEYCVGERVSLADVYLYVIV